MLLTLAELEAFACLGLTGFLTFNHTAVAAQQAFDLKSGTIFDVVLTQSACNSHAQCLSLTGNAATVEVGFDIPFAFCISHLECLADDVLQRAGGEIFFVIAVVDGDFTSAGSHIDAGYGGLSSTYCIDNFCHLILRR